MMDGEANRFIVLKQNFSRVEGFQFSSLSDSGSDANILNRIFGIREENGASGREFHFVSEAERVNDLHPHSQKGRRRHGRLAGSESRRASSVCERPSARRPLD